ncbi:energy transducer TonB [uncultured Roseivirga sp.]|uniref:energy transducer TonB n=1 Tax=uncultured Roseivirga sp. TaxID=543088 RepID=UPI0030DBB742
MEEYAKFPGGWDEWAKFLNKNFEYPRQAQRSGIEGTVHLSFVVDAKGIISDIEVTRGIGGGCNEEAIRVLKLSPKWTPGKQRGVAVKSRMAIQIKFGLR